MGNCNESQTNVPFFLPASLVNKMVGIFPDGHLRIIIVPFTGIKSVERLANSCLRVFLDPDIKEEVIVSQKKLALFKKWMDS